MKLVRRRSRRAAFTIVEVVVAMGILLVGMSAILGLLTFGAAMTRNAALKTAGASAVEAIVADLEEGLFPIVKDEQTGEFVVGAPQAIEGRAVPGHPGLTYSARGVPDPDDRATPGGALRWRVDVEIRWVTSGRARTRSFSTLLLRQVPFGERLRREFIDGETLAPQTKKI
ncbi:MAG: prepilin-type N-terminal cleavage/methylation domain-containing protein [Planctomycetes bacterium]|nr:prepilin-type N-terminal cleavage/methylation domain-containing protein [Planctomycetota bacterium]